MDLGIRGERVGDAWCGEHGVWCFWLMEACPLSIGRMSTEPQLCGRTHALHIPTVSTQPLADRV
jgi:hypothetical protein